MAKAKKQVRSKARASGGPAVSVALLGSFEFARTGAGKVRLPKKAQALLAFLALGRGQAFARDRLATLLWGERDTERARQSLRQCLVVLRAAIGAEADRILVAENDTVTLVASDSLTVDVDRFAVLAASDRRQDLEDAHRLCGGEFLAGLTIREDSFAHWVAIERERLASLTFALLLRLADMQAADDDVGAAVATARELVALDPLREEAHRLLMRLLARSGNRTGALQHYARCVEVLRAELGVAPERETAALAMSIRNDAIRNDTIRTDAGSEDRELQGAGSPRIQTLPDKPSIAVLPFVNLSGDDSRDYFIRGLVEDMTVALGREKWLFVVASASTFAIGSGVGLKDIGAQLGVRYVLRGSVRMDGRHALLVAQLNDVADGHSVWSGRFEDEIDHVFALQDRLTSRVAAAIAPALKSTEVERARHKRTTDLTAFDLYLQALPRFRASLEENRHALALLARAVTLDPGYGAAYGLASRCFQFQKMFDWVPPRDRALDEGIRLGRRAAETGRDDSEALWMAGLALVHLSGEIDHALALVERSLSLNPNSADAWTASTLIHSYRGNRDTAVAHFETAQRLNPLDQSQHLHWNILGWAHIAAGDYHKAADAADRTLRIQPNYLPGLRIKVAMCGLLGHNDEGSVYLARLRAAQPRFSIAWMRDLLDAPLRGNRELLDRYLEGFRRIGAPETL